MMTIQFSPFKSCNIYHLTESYAKIALFKNSQEKKHNKNSTLFFSFKKAKVI